MSSPADTHSSTDRLLDILRGKPVSDPQDSDAVVTAEPIEPEPASSPTAIGLSEAERRALMTPGGQPDFKQRKPPKPATGLNFRLPMPTLSGLKTAVLAWLGLKQSYIGLDIGTRNVKYMEFTPGAAGPTLRSYGILPIRAAVADAPTDDEKTVVIRALLKTQLIARSHVFTAVSGPQTVIRHILMPKVAKDELHEAILWNARKDLPFDAQAALIDYRILGEVTDKGVQKLSVLVALAEEQVIRTHLALLDKAGIVPSRVVVVPLALFNAWHATVDQQEQQDAIIIEIGATNCYVLFVKDGLLQFAREINIGGNEIAAGLSGSISTADGIVELTPDQAEQILQDVGIPDTTDFKMTRYGISNSQFETLIVPAVERLSAQIQRTMDYFRSKFSSTEPEKVYLSGGVARMPGLLKFLSDALDKEVYQLNPFAAMPVSPELQNDAEFLRIRPSFTIAYGIGANGLKGLNLLPADVKAIPQQALQLRLLKTAAVFVGLLLSILTWVFWGGPEPYIRQLAEATEQLNSVQPAVQQALQLQDSRKQLNDNYNTLLNSVQSIGQTFDVVGVMQMLSNSTPEYIRMNEVIIAEGGGTRTILRGTLLDTGPMYEMLLTRYGVFLENTGLFQAVEPYRQFPRDDGAGVDFEFVCVLNPAAPVKG